MGNASISTKVELVVGNYRIQVVIKTPTNRLKPSPNLFPVFFILLPIT